MEGDTVRLRTWLSALVAAAILGSPAWAAESTPAVYTFGTLKAPTVEAARAQAQAWLEKAGQFDQKAFDAHGKAEHTKQMLSQLQPIRLSDYDQRPYKTLTAGPPPAAA